LENTYLVAGAAPLRHVPFARVSSRSTINGASPPPEPCERERDGRPQEKTRAEEKAIQSQRANDHRLLFRQYLYPALIKIDIN